MRIAFLTPLWPVSLAQNGIATYVDAMRRALEAEGHECVVLAMRPLEELRDPGVFAVPKPARGFVDKQLSRIKGALDSRFFDYGYAQARVAHALAELHRQKPIDILETEESFGIPLAAVGATSASVVIRSHGPHFLVKQPPHDSRDARRIQEEGQAYAAVDAASFPSKALRDAVAARYGLTFQASAAFPNPVDIPPSGETWTLDGCERNKILFVGRFDSLKGGDLALKAFDALLARFPDARLTLAGADHGVAGPDGAPQNFADFARANLSEKARSQIEFLGRVPHEEIPALRRKALVSLSASLFETFSYAVAEALALGAPVVTSATASLTEYLTHDEEALFAPPGDADGLRVQLERCLAEPEFAARIGAAGRRTAERMFAPAAVAAGALDFYQHVLETAQRRKRARA
ncbi:glycosyltransferase family 4 protein [Hyphococcus luteus]|uniref:Uncharacterized protein n=1 Tax=Hyphococcus luteus TaxID=2058213 RepID=A0A2S7K7P5_9PROT|nr:glycosyltransferase family 4 protein [Marinicaulis flavus]PQA88537.1 hypothetical protein CW354_09655 [Marinicaulis flavus]